MERSHLGGVRVRSVQDPFTAGIEQDVGSQAGSEDHRAPLEAGVQRLVGITQADPSEPGKRDIEGADKDAQTDNEIIASHLITQEIADGADGVCGAFRTYDKPGTERQDA